MGYDYRNPRTLKVHPENERLVPRMSAQKRAAFIEAVRRDGKIRDALEILPDGTVLCGRERRAAAHGLLSSWRDVDRTTVFRALVRMKVSTGRVKQERDRDMRRFAYAHRMELVLADGKHFRAGAARARRVAFFFLDDATRLGLEVVVGSSESAALFLRGFHAVLRDQGRMGILYLDRGPGFVADAVAEVCRRLEIALIHGERRYPEGHGKVERFNQTAASALLRSLNGRPDVDPECAALEVRLGHWLREVYNHDEHESLVRP